MGCSASPSTDGELPIGLLVVSWTSHYTAVIDGVIDDTHDPQRSASWTFEPVGQGRQTNHKGIWTEIGGRCVNGYLELRG